MSVSEPLRYLSPVERASQAAWKPQDIRHPWQWCEDFVEVDKTSPMPGMWRLLNSPWVKELMEEAGNKRNRFIAVKCSAQSSKTQTILNLLFWTISEDPGPTMYALANQVDAADFVRDRFVPSLQSCAPVKAAMLRETKSAFTFRTMPLYFLGAGSKAKFQGKPMKRLFLDEVRNYPPGAYETILKRVRSFDQLSQVFVISTPGPKGDAVDQAFLRGDQRTPHFPCPKCEHLQQLKMEQLKSEHPETHLCVKWKDVPGARTEQGWNFETLGKSIRYECSKCGHLIADNPTERKRICRTAVFIRMNPNADAGDVSFTWNALLPWWVPWREIAKEYLSAIEAAKSGNIEPMKTFVTETLGESWEDRHGVVEDFGFLEARKANYAYGEVWAEAGRRFMSADKQEKGGENYWWVVREFGPFGKSRLVAHGNCKTKAELEQLRKDFKVSTLDAMIDSGYLAQEVYRFCGATGWKCFKGDHVEFYLVNQEDPKTRQIAPVRQLWRKTQAVVYNSQTKRRIGVIPLFTFAGGSITDLLMDYMMGLVGDWTIPDKTEREYLRQLTGERREQVTDTRGGVSLIWKRVSDNHYLDCERMILVAAMITKTINAASNKR